MNKGEVINALHGFRDRLHGDVIAAYASRGSSFGRERFAAWRRQFTKFLDETLPGTTAKLNAKLQKYAFLSVMGSQT